MNSQLDKILDKLTTVAKKDGLITDDEDRLIKSLMSDAEKYVNVLNDALADGVIEKGEQSRLLQYRLNIANKAKKIALDDMIITSEEKELMLELHRILRNMEKIHK